MPRMSNEFNVEFGKVWEQTAVKVRAYIFCICRDRNDTDDLAQECYLRALRNWEQFDGKGSRQAWLFTIARRTCVDWFRTKRKSVQISLDTLGELQEVVSEKRNPDDIEIVWEIIKSLKPEYKEILYLRFAGGLNYAEMAKTLDIPLGTVRSRLHRGLRALRTKIEEQKNGT
jgi:RNA polymerase sigma-70 factor (ECF subfamily)